MVFSVSRGKEAALKTKMALLGIKEADLEEKFIRSSKSGVLAFVPFAIFLTNLSQNHSSKCPRDRLKLKAGTP